MPWILRDNVLAPREEIVLNYSGPNPFLAYGVLRRAFDIRLKIRAKDIFEDDFRWDITVDPRDFYVKIRIRKSYDNFSKGWIYIELRGSQPTDPKKVGKLTVKFMGFLETIWKIDGWKKIFLPFLYIYHVTFYNKQRRRYLNELKRFVSILEEEIRRNLKIK